MLHLVDCWNSILLARAKARTMVAREESTERAVPRARLAARVESRAWPMARTRESFPSSSNEPLPAEEPKIQNLQPN